jgi:all-trans-retinol 13,14-reductase
MNTQHIVIIGSGLGGLACGYILAKKGFRVTVLEKNAQSGGCLQTFVRHGVAFETGMHYIGSMDEGQLLYRYFRYLSLLPDVPTRPLDPAAYDLIAIGGQRFPFANGTEHFIDALAGAFPRERENLRRYRSAVRAIVEASPLYAPTYSESYLSNPAIHRSASAFIESFTANRLLQGVLAGNNPLYAGVKDRTPLYIHAMISDFYHRSAHRIVGGSDRIAHSLIRSIQAMGGCVRNHAPVTKINCCGHRATGVTLASGEELLADYVLSAIHPVRTAALLDTPLIRKIYRERLASLRNTIGNFTVYLEFAPDAVPYLNTNFYYYRTPDDIWRESQYRRDDPPHSFLYMHLCASPHQAHARAAVLMTYMNYDDVAPWANTSVGRRGPSYEAFKQQKAEQLLQCLEEQLPGVRAHIVRYHTSTPLTYRDYTGTEKGSMYGILHDCTAPLQTLIPVRTKLANLFQTGQNVNFHGILGVIVSAVITAGELVGAPALFQEIKG